jgi:hypothetical protein
MVYADSGVVRNSGVTRNIAVHSRFIYVQWSTCDTCDGSHEWATFRRSVDAGHTFEPFRRLFPANNGWATITADDSLVLFRWTERPLTPAWLAISSDYAVAWQHRQLLSGDWQRHCRSTPWQSTSVMEKRFSLARALPFIDLTTEGATWTERTKGIERACCYEHCGKGRVDAE